MKNAHTVMNQYKISTNIDSQIDCIRICVGAKGNVMVKILNTHGKFVKTIRDHQSNNDIFSVKVDDLSSGNYVVNVFKDDSFVKSFQYNRN